MSYELILIYGGISIFLGIGPTIIFALWKFGIKKEVWLSWILGAFFWFLALLARIYIIIYISSTPQTLPYRLILLALLAGLFETTFRVLLLLLFTKKTASATNKIFMAGLGWGTGEAIYVHTLNLSISLFIIKNNSLIQQLEGIEYTLIFGGLERIMTEIFHLCMIILVFYGIKNKLKYIDKSSPIQNGFFSRDPKPIIIWIIIVICLHFSYDYINVSLYNAFGLFFFIYGFGIDILLVFYLLNRIKSYPLFPEILKKGENAK